MIESASTGIELLKAMWQTFVEVSVPLLVLSGFAAAGVAWFDNFINPDRP